MSKIGWVVVVAAIVGAGAYFGGYMDGDAQVSITPKGRDAISSGLESTRRGINTGLEAAQKSINSGLDAAQAQNGKAATK